MKNIRGSGLYQWFSLPSPEQKAAVVEAALQQEWLLLLGSGRNSVRFQPDLNVTTDDIDELAARLDRVLTRLVSR